MPVQRADDDARHNHGIFHGFNKRWWMDWTFQQYAALIVVTLGSFPFLLFLPGVPALLIFIASWLVFPNAIRGMPDMGMSKTTKRRVVAGMLFLVPVLFTLLNRGMDAWRFWVMPASFLPFIPAAIVSIVGAIICGALAAMRLPRYIDDNRPFRHQRAVVRKEIAAPRPRREPASFEEVHELQFYDDRPLINDIQFAALLINPKEIIVPRFISIPVEVDAIYWDPSNVKSAGEAMVALMNRKTTLNFAGNDTVHIYGADRDDTPSVLAPGSWILFFGDGTFDVLDDEKFRQRFVKPEEYKSIVDTADLAAIR